MQPLSGFSPDLDPATPGIITDCDMLEPIVGGMRGAYSYVASSHGALASESRGAFQIQLADGTNRLFVGTQTKLYEGTTGAWVDVSSGSYTGGPDSYWRMCQFGNVTIAVNKVDATQKNISSGSFSALAGAPKAALCDVVNGFVMLADYNDGTDTPDGVYWSGYQNYTAWTPSLTTQAGFMRLYDAPGRIVGLKAIGKNVAVYKDRAIWLGTYQGPPTLWGFELITNEIGAPCQEAIINVGNFHLFVGQNDFYMFDGTRPVPLESPLRKWFFNQLNDQYRYKIKSLHNRADSLVYWFYPSSSSSNGDIDSGIAYNYKTNQWGQVNRSIESAVEYVTPGVTYDGLGTLYATYDDLPTNISFDSPVWLGGSRAPAVIAEKKLNIITGESLQSQLTIYLVGDDNKITAITRVRPRFIVSPVSGTIYSKKLMNSGGAASPLFGSYQTNTLNNGKFDIRQSSRWHKLTMEFTGNMVISGINIDMQAEGDR